jgi:peptidoglycan/LPS O-acetylase OafA/YrhL
MATFFVLSGFVIHYNYHDLRKTPGGIRRFFEARFARLYPLYIVLLTIDVLISMLYHRTSCGLAGDTPGSLMALPYFLTMTQSWTYGVICNNSFIYQFHVVSAVMWSISVEAFFYIVYVFIANWLGRVNETKRQFAVALGFYGVSVAVLWWFWRSPGTIEHVAQVTFGPIATERHGYQDSLIRWLNYFNPVSNLPAFVCGAVAANTYMGRHKPKPGQSETRWAGPLVVLTSLCMLAVHFWFTIGLAPRNMFFDRCGSVLYVPFMALSIYTMARYPATTVTKMVGSSALVKLGEASYSIYLLHALLGRLPKHLSFLHLNPWLLCGISLAIVLTVSRISYLKFERPAQKWVRDKLRGPAVRAQYA